MRRIDWEFVADQSRAAKTWSDDEIAAAVQTVNAMPPKKNDPNKLAQIWAPAKPLPTVRDLDFRRAQTKTVALSRLQSTDKSLKRDKLLWHVQHPGQAVNPGPLTSHPIVLDDPKGPIIVDGHHRLAAMSVLGAKSCQCWLIPPT